MRLLLPLVLVLACDPDGSDSGPGTDGGDADGGDADGGDADGGDADGGDSDGGDADGGSSEDEHIWVSSSATWTTLSTGSQHACAIDTAGTVSCWGYDWDGRIDVPDLQTPVQAIACGGDFSCALDAEGTVQCWGAETPVLTDAPRGSFAAVVAGYDYACVLDADGEPTCWGNDEHQQLQVQGGPFVQLTAGRTHVCGLDADGQATCWGGQDPVSTPGHPTPPHDGEVVDYGQTELPAGSWQSISAGDYHTCMANLDGLPICVGNDRAGETDPPADLRVELISAGGAHSCGLDSGGLVHCWGADTASWDYFQALEPSGSFEGLDTASVYTCGLRSTAVGQEILCWGALDDLPVQVP